MFHCWRNSQKTVIDIHMGSGGDEKNESIPEEVRLAKNVHVKVSIGDISHY